MTQEGFQIAGWLVTLPSKFEAVFLFEAEERARYFAANNRAVIEPLYRKNPCNELPSSLPP